MKANATHNEGATNRPTVRVESDTLPNAYALRLIAKASKTAKAKAKASKTAPRVAKAKTAKAKATPAQREAEGARAFRVLSPKVPALRGAELPAWKGEPQWFYGAHKATKPTLQRMSRFTVLRGNTLLAMRQGESAYSALSKRIQPCADKTAQDSQAKAHAIASYLSQGERLLLDKLTLQRMKERNALALALAGVNENNSGADTRPAFSLAHLSHREQRLFRALQVKRRKRALRSIVSVWPMSRPVWEATLEAMPLKERASLPVQWAIKRLTIRLSEAKTKRDAMRLQRNVDKQAGACAGQRARFYSIGSATLEHKESGARIGRKQAKAIAPRGGAVALSVDEEKGAYALDTRQGTGRVLERQAITEMMLAARVVLLSGGDWHAANKATYEELKREQPIVWETFAKAQGCANREWKKEQAAYDEEQAKARLLVSDEESAQDEEHEQGAEFEPLSFKVSGKPRTFKTREELEAHLEREHKAECYKGALHGMQSVVAYWRASRSPYKVRGVRDDIAKVRALALAKYKRLPMQSLRASDRKADNEANGEYMDCYRLKGRCEKGAELLATAKAIASRVAYREERNRALRLNREARAQAAMANVIALPLGRLEHAGRDATLGALPALARILARHHAKTAHGAKARSEAKAHKEQMKREARQRAKAVLRAPLPTDALQALQDWHPVAK